MSGALKIYQSTTHFFYVNRAKDSVIPRKGFLNSLKIVLGRY